MSYITVEPVSANQYLVTVTDGGTTTTHQVTVDQKHGPTEVTGEDLVRASFLFLLDREPKESILGEFELSVISRYFPEYESKIGDYFE